MSLFKKKEENVEVAEEKVELQTTVNEDSIEQLNDEDTIVENVDAEEEE